MPINIRVHKCITGIGWHRLTHGLPHFSPIREARFRPPPTSDDGLDVALTTVPARLANLLQHLRVVAIFKQSRLLNFLLPKVAMLGVGRSLDHQPRAASMYLKPLKNQQALEATPQDQSRSFSAAATCIFQRSS